MNKPDFGTDGIRGRYGEIITEEMGWRLGQSMASFADSAGLPYLWVAQDSRPHSPALEEAVLSGMAQQPLRIRRCGMLPSGCLSWLIAKYGGLGIMITASHNDVADNGFKILGERGKCSPAELDAIMAHWPNSNSSTPAQPSTGQLSSAKDYSDEIISHVIKKLDVADSLQGTHVVLDGAEGAASNFSPCLFEAVGAKVDAHHCSGEGQTINQGCGTNHPQRIQALTSEAQADYGFSLDGDGDRMIMAARAGSNSLQLCDGDALLYSWIRLAADKPQGVGGTQMTNSALEEALQNMGIGFARSDVGEQPLVALMRERGWHLGGEPSGHLLDLSILPSCDGSILALRTAALIARSGQDIAAVLADWCPLPTYLHNVQCQNSSTAMTKMAPKIKAMEEYLGQDGRVLARPSGTEPLVRILVETRKGNPEELAKEIAAGV